MPLHIVYKEITVDGLLVIVVSTIALQAIGEGSIPSWSTMIKEKITIPIYGYTMWLVKLSKSDYKGKKLSTAKIGLKSKPIELDDETCKEIDDNIEAGDLDGAITCHIGSYRKLVVFFYPITDKERQIEIFCHEKRHCEDFILNFLDVNDKEAAAYLAGWLGKVFWKFLKK